MGKSGSLCRTEQTPVFWEEGECLYHSEEAAKPAKVFSVLSPRPSLQPLSAAWHLSSLGFAEGQLHKQDDPSCWPHAPEPGLALTAVEHGWMLAQSQKNRPNDGYHADEEHAEPFCEYAS
ncbi:unnamed protein product [Pleuronectes platessa]|uniref:Uncharacterized protein n=1 Tax=Pleuronectes platessa TaxID=8262 RepID=A0A9N7U4X6_PLEPL|nr:unnamed protein product [Pleuronectes platessa]